jgi:hypothetical protein
LISFTIGRRLQGELRLRLWELSADGEIYSLKRTRYVGLNGA